VSRCCEKQNQHHGEQPHDQERCHSDRRGVLGGLAAERGEPRPDAEQRHHCEPVEQAVGEDRAQARGERHARPGREQRRAHELAQASGQEPGRHVPHDDRREHRPEGQRRPDRREQHPPAPDTEDVVTEIERRGQQQPAERGLGDLLPYLSRVRSSQDERGEQRRQQQSGQILDGSSHDVAGSSLNLGQS
jgi:hypothetical protein